MTGPGGAPPPEVALLDEPIALEPLAVEATDRFFEEYPQDVGRRGGTARDWCVHDTKYLLAWALEGRQREPEGFLANVAWLAEVLEARDYPRERLARHLELTAAVVAERLREPGRELAELMTEGAAHVRAGDHGGTKSTRRWAAAYADALLDGDVAQAQAVVDAVSESNGAGAVYLEVLAPALVDLGERWARGEISVAQEHLASAFTEAVAARLAPQLPRGSARGKCAVVSCVDGEYHCIGARFIADFLEADGWDTLVLGASTPPDGVVELARRRGAALVALSSTLTTHLGNAAEAVAALRAGAPDILIAVGGRAYAGSHEVAEEVGADVFADDAERFIQILRERFDG